MKWINEPSRTHNRSEYLSLLIPLVRFPMMSVHFLHDVVSRFVEREPQFLPLFVEALKYHALGSERVEIEQSTNTTTQSSQFRFF
jgi:hypothetical protein